MIRELTLVKQLEKRASMLRAIRDFFYNNNYLEVETPIRIPTLIPEEYIQPFESEGWYLQPSPEICMKRLAASGYDKIFQICRCFRKDEIGDRHLTELTMLEWYRKDYSYIELMNECEAMIKYVAKILIEDCSSKHLKDSKELEDICDNSLSIRYGDCNISINKPWQRITVSEAFDQYGGITVEEAEKNGSFDEIMAFKIEPSLGLEIPTFILDYPASMASLAKLKLVEKLSITDKEKKVAERFELYIAGVELANGFSELTDPIEQRDRFKKTLDNLINIGRVNSKDNIKMPEKFIKDLANLPTTAGIALGIDRLAMIFTNSKTIDRVVAFTPEEI